VNHRRRPLFTSPPSFVHVASVLCSHVCVAIESLCISFGLVGIVRFLDCYYITLITRRQKVGMIGGESIYTIKNTEMIPLRGCVVGEHNAGQHERERQVRLREAARTHSSF